MRNGFSGTTGKTRTWQRDGEVVVRTWDRGCKRSSNVHQGAAAWLETVQSGEEGLKRLNLIGCTEAPEDGDGSLAGGTRARAIARRL